MIPADPIPQITPPVEDYLKAIYSLAHEGNAERVSTSEIAERMDVSAASATNMMQKLAEMRLVDYVPYKGVALTGTGEKIALEVIRHHRLIELYLSEALGYSWDTVHEEAERLEHVISEEFEDRIDAMLGHPTTDPHGDPIPPKSGGLPPAETLRRLSEVAAGERVVVQRVSDRDGAVLRRLSSLAIHPGVEIRVTGCAPGSPGAPGGGSITLELGESQVSIDEALARRIYVG